MIAIIGYENDIIGFGLAGISRLQELPQNATKQQVLDAIKEANPENAIIIAEKLHDLVRGAPEIEGLLIIDIPENKEETEDRISSLAKELLGVSL